jgi:small redox-active disulfide protein 2
MNMNIQVLGTGCSRCKTLFEMVKKAVLEAGVTAVVEKVEDIEKIMSYELLMTPGLVINGQVKAAGRIPKLEELKTMLQAASAN